MGELVENVARIEHVGSEVAGQLSVYIPLAGVVETGLGWSLQDIGPDRANALVELYAKRPDAALVAAASIMAASPQRKAVEVSTRGAGETYIAPSMDDVASVALAQPASRVAVIRKLVADRIPVKLLAPLKSLLAVDFSGVVGPEVIKRVLAKIASTGAEESGEIVGRVLNAAAVNAIGRAGTAAVMLGNLGPLPALVPMARRTIGKLLAYSGSQDEELACESASGELALESPTNRIGMDAILRKHGLVFSTGSQLHFTRDASIFRFFHERASYVKYLVVAIEWIIHTAVEAGFLVGDVEWARGDENALASIYVRIWEAALERKHFQKGVFPGDFKSAVMMYLGTRADMFRARTQVALERVNGKFLIGASHRVYVAPSERELAGLRMGVFLLQAYLKFSHAYLLVLESVTNKSSREEIKRQAAEWARKGRMKGVGYADDAEEDMPNDASGDLINMAPASAGPARGVVHNQTSMLDRAAMLTLNLPKAKLIVEIERAARAWDRPTAPEISIRGLKDFPALENRLIDAIASLPTASLMITALRQSSPDAFQRSALPLGVLGALDRSTPEITYQQSILFTAAPRIMSRNPRFGQLASSNGEITEGDDFGLWDFWCLVQAWVTLWAFYRGHIEQGLLSLVVLTVLASAPNDEGDLEMFLAEVNPWALRVILTGDTFLFWAAVDRLLHRTRFAFPAGVTAWFASTGVVWRLWPPSFALPIVLYLAAWLMRGHKLKWAANVTLFAAFIILPAHLVYPEFSKSVVTAAHSLQSPINTASAHMPHPIDHGPASQPDRWSWSAWAEDLLDSAQQRLNDASGSASESMEWPARLAATTLESVKEAAEAAIARTTNIALPAVAGALEIIRPHREALANATAETAYRFLSCENATCIGEAALGVASSAVGAVAEQGATTGSKAVEIATKGLHGVAETTGPYIVTAVNASHDVSRVVSEAVLATAVGGIMVEAGRGAVEQASQIAAVLVESVSDLVGSVESTTEAPRAAMASWATGLLHGVADGIGEARRACGNAAHLVAGEVVPGVRVSECVFAGFSEALSAFSDHAELCTGDWATATLGESVERSRNPRDSQLASSNGEITEGDDVAGKGRTGKAGKGKPLPHRAHHAAPPSALVPDARTTNPNQKEKPPLEVFSDVPLRSLDDCRSVNASVGGLYHKYDRSELFSMAGVFVSPSTSKKYALMDGLFRRTFHMAKTFEAYIMDPGLTEAAHVAECLRLALHTKNTSVRFCHSHTKEAVMRAVEEATPERILSCEAAERAFLDLINQRGGNPSAACNRYFERLASIQSGMRAAPAPGTPKSAEREQTRTSSTAARAGPPSDHEEEVEEVEEHGEEEESDESEEGDDESSVDQRSEADDGERETGDAGAQLLADHGVGDDSAAHGAGRKYKPFAAERLPEPVFKWECAIEWASLAQTVCAIVGSLIFIAIAVPSALGPTVPALIAAVVHIRHPEIFAALRTACNSFDAGRFFDSLPLHAESAQTGARRAGWVALYVALMCSHFIGRWETTLSLASLALVVVYWRPSMSSGMFLAMCQVCLLLPGGISQGAWAMGLVALCLALRSRLGRSTAASVAATISKTTRSVLAEVNAIKDDPDGKAAPKLPEFIRRANERLGVWKFEAKERSTLGGVRLKKPTDLWYLTCAPTKQDDTGIVYCRFAKVAFTGGPSHVIRLFHHVSSAEPSRNAGFYIVTGLGMAVGTVNKDIMWSSEALTRLARMFLGQACGYVMWALGEADYSACYPTESAHEVVRSVAVGIERLARTPTARFVVACFTLLLMLRAAKWAFTKCFLAWYGVKGVERLQYHAVHVTAAATGAALELAEQNPPGVDHRASVHSNTLLAADADFRTAHFYHYDCHSFYDENGVVVLVLVEGVEPCEEGAGSARSAPIEWERVCNSFALPAVFDGPECKRAVNTAGLTLTNERIVNIRASDRVAVHADSMQVIEVAVWAALGCSESGNLNAMAPRSTSFMGQSWGKCVMLSVLSRLLTW